MRALLQRVSEAQVRIDGDVVGACGPGLMILVCAMRGDTEAKAETVSYTHLTLPTICSV